MKVLVINSGSSSLKYQLVEMNNEDVLAKGVCDRIGLEHSFIKHTDGTGKSTVIEKDLYNHTLAIKEVLKALTDEKIGVIKDMSEIGAVGHRVVHGGEEFKDSVVIDESVIRAIDECSELAPLHNPPNLTGINACRQLMPGVPMVAVFDTAFHQTMPDYAYIYALPYEIYDKYKLRKYGFHGTSHKYVAERTAEFLNKPLSEMKIITCHLGNGASICAVKGGVSVETSMGFTPLQGLAMGTRSGNIDPAVITYLMKKESMNTAAVENFLNKKSGVLGVSGVSSDFRDLQDACDSGNKRAQLAQNIFCYSVKKTIGEYAAVLNGVDAIVFTAGIGENDDVIREKVLEDLDYLGVKMDKSKNNVRGKATILSTEDSTTVAMIMPTNEELAIAREAKRLLIN